MENTELVEIKERFRVATENMSKQNLIHLCKQYNKMNRGNICCGCAWKGVYKIVENWLKQI